MQIEERLEMIERNIKDLSNKITKSEVCEREFNNIILKYECLNKDFTYMKEDLVKLEGTAYTKDNFDLLQKDIEKLESELKLLKESLNMHESKSISGRLEKYDSYKNQIITWVIIFLLGILATTLFKVP